MEDGGHHAAAIPNILFPLFHSMKDQGFLQKKKKLNPFYLNHNFSLKRIPPNLSTSEMVAKCHHSMIYGHPHQSPPCKPLQ